MVLATAFAIKQLILASVLGYTQALTVMVLPKLYCPNVILSATPSKLNAPPAVPDSYATPLIVPKVPVTLPAVPMLVNDVPVPGYEDELPGS